MILRAGLDVVTKRIISVPAENQTSVVHPTASHILLTEIYWSIISYTKILN